MEDLINQRAKSEWEGDRASTESALPSYKVLQISMEYQISTLNTLL